MVCTDKVQTLQLDVKDGRGVVPEILLMDPNAEGCAEGVYRTTRGAPPKRISKGPFTQAIFLSQQLNAIFVAPKLQPAAISLRF